MFEALGLNRSASCQINRELELYDSRRLLEWKAVVQSLPLIRGAYWGVRDSSEGLTRGIKNRARRLMR